MKFTNLFLISISLVLFQSCSDDNSPIEIPEPDSEQSEEPQVEEEVDEEEPINISPDSFSLLSLEDGEEDSDLNPQLKWGAANDQDGDTVTYQLILDYNESPENVLVENLTETQFTITESLERNTLYFWKVIASDNNGNETESSETYSFSTKGISFSETALTANTEFTARRNHSITEFNGKLWMIGGQDDNESYDNVYSSADGSSWELEAENPFDVFNKSNHTTVVFKNKLWAIGGWYSDIWSSTNGKDWTMETATPNFGAREGHSTVVFNNKIWVIGGSEGPDQFNDVWYSDDGITWSLAIENAQFSPRMDHTTVVHDNKMYLIGGTSVTNFSPSFYNDIYVSTDGITWTQISAESSFEVRSDHTSLVFDNKIWVIGGWSAVNNEETFEQDVASFDDVWYSENGIQWSNLNVSESYSPRMGHASAVFDGKIIISGGLNIKQADNSRTHYNDVWVVE
ncbi:kelch repeat-containing protein [Pseudozobellia sp. WGM2]|uniref:Kelch repeat-containing protein n=1 Tax=Pseudozobellia sp. WGM2 TaxID=2787625 RepID=UPI001AE06965|nr:kelch repeat-containing protein [Pseudozobellia sp. WGM2]